MKIHLTIIIAAFLLFAGCQEDKISPDLFGTLTGEVIYEVGGQPVEGANISSNPATSNMLTNFDGTFEFESIKVGTYSIRAELEGYTTAVQSITIEEDQTASVVLRMEVAQVNNQPPSTAFNPVPSNGVKDLGLSLELTWEATDPDEDELTYDVYLFDQDTPQDNLIAGDLSEPNVLVDDLRYGKKYFWQVAVKDGEADPVFGEVWEFTTESFPDHRFAYAKISNSIYEIHSGGIVNEKYQLTFNGSNYRPRFSPEGNRIAYINANLPEKRLFFMNRDGTDQTEVKTPYPIDSENNFDLDFTWSPDGTALLYMSGKRLYKINIDGTGAELLAQLNNEEFQEVAWAGSSNLIAARVVGDLPYESRILLYNEGGVFQEILIPDVPGSIGGPQFSIDGESVLYTVDVTGFESPIGRQLDSHIFLKDIASGTVTDLSIEKPDGFNDLDPKFSPNGAFVIFTQTSNTLNAQKDIYIMTHEGEGRQLLFENAEMPDWWE